jgi:mRNA interferase MazF
MALQGDFGKPRPALVVQADHFGKLTTITALPVTSTLVDAPLLRLAVEPDAQNNLARPSQVMIDKLITLRREQVGEPFGRAGDELMLGVNRALAVFLGIA